MLPSHFSRSLNNNIRIYTTYNATFRSAYIILTVRVCVNNKAVYLSRSYFHENGKIGNERL